MGAQMPIQSNLCTEGLLTVRTGDDGGIILCLFLLFCGSGSVDSLTPLRTLEHQLGQSRAASS